jgi:hypothetical protein
VAANIIPTQSPTAAASDQESVRMKQSGPRWIAAGVVVLGLAALTIWLGTAIMPSRATAQDVGTIIPWYITWAMIWATALIGVVIAANLLAIGISGRHTS